MLQREICEGIRVVLSKGFLVHIVDDVFIQVLEILMILKFLKVLLSDVLFFEQT